MSDVTTALSPGQASKLAVLLDALDGVAVSDAERASLAWLGSRRTPWRTSLRWSAVPGRSANR